MLFNSMPFILLFLPITLGLYYWIGRNHHRAAAAFLGLASLFFYGWWSLRYVGLLLISICLNFLFSELIYKYRSASRAILIIALSGNLALLAYYKYANFFVENINSVTGTDWVVGTIILPLGISFFTFTQIAFLVDTYRNIAHERNCVHYLLFVTYFPHLIAGPILHHSEMMPQFGQPKTYRMDSGRIAIGLTLFIFGLAKKVICADGISPLAQSVFGAAAAGHPIELLRAWYGALAYTMQIYFDFSAYTDMAIGVSFMFGISLPLNFDSPYKALNIVDFWRRWHMTLSRFLRDYLYIPLGGNRRSSYRRYANLMVTMLLGGLWHGAAWTYVAWGALHGFYLAINHVWRHACRKIGLTGSYGRTAKVAGGFVTFLAVVIAWVFFRAPTLRSAHIMIGGMFGANGIDIPVRVRFLERTFAQIGLHAATKPWPDITNMQIVVLILLMSICWLFPNGYQLLGKFNPSLQSPQESRPRQLSWKPNFIWAVAIGALGALAISQMLSGAPSEFIYFQF